MLYNNMYVVLWLFVYVLCIGQLYGQNVEVRTPVGNITIEQCQVLKKTISKTAYFDTAAGTSDLQLTLLDQFRKDVLPESTLVQLNSQDRILYMVPESKAPVTDEVRKYFIRALNPNTGDYVDDCFYVTLQGIVPSPNFQVTFKADVLIPSPSKTETLYRFIEKLYERSQRDIFTGKDVFINDSILVQRTGYQEIELTYQNCTIRPTPCDFAATQQIRLMYGLFGGKDTLEAARKKEFFDLILPDFNITSMSNSFIGACTGISDLGPTSDFTFVGPLIINAPSIPPYPGLYTLDFPKGAFTSEVSTDVIRIELMEIIAFNDFGMPLFSNVNVLRSYWAFIWHDIFDIAFPYKLDIVLVDQSWTILSADWTGTLFIRFLVRGIDQLNRQDQFELKLNPGVQPTSYYVITFQFSSFSMFLTETTDTTIMVLQMKKFMTKLINVFTSYTSTGVDYSVLINLKNFFFTSTVNSLSVGTAIWAINVGPQCDVNLIKTTQEIMFTSVKDNIINSVFKQKFENFLVLESISEQFNNPCKQSPPKKMNSIPPLSVSYCGLFQYTIPANTFNDDEDGNTRTLTLTLKDESNQALSSDSWLQFDQTSQKIFALLPSDLTLTTRQFKFILTASDTTDLSVSCDVIVNIIDSPKPSSFTVTLRGKYTPQASLNAQTIVAQRVGDFFGDAGSGFQLLSLAEVSTGDPYIEFTNCTWRNTPCDILKINGYKITLFGDDNVAEQNFVSIFQPEFTDVVINGARVGVCTNNQPPTNPNPWGPLTCTTCETYKQQIPVNTFHDVEQGNTRNLKATCGLLNDDLSTATLPYWANFNDVTQQLTMIASDQLEELQYTFQMSAFDIDGLSVTQPLTVNVVKETGEPSHMISMTVTVTSSDITDYVTLYQQFRESIQFYFGDTIPTVSLIQTDNYPNTQYKCKWSNCTVSRTTCEQEKIDYIKSQIIDAAGNLDVSFTNSLKSHFTVDEFSFQESGICEEVKKPPMVTKEISAQDITYCGYLEYVIPADTFMDTIDGNTRQLSLSMSDEDGNTLPDDSWLYFNKDEQKITAILQSINPMEKTEYKFRLIATNSRSLSNFTEITINIVGEPFPKRISLRVDTFSTLPTKASAEVFARFLDKTADVFPTDVENLHLYDGGFLSDAFFLQAYIINCNCSFKFIEEEQENIRGYDLTKYEPEFTSLNLNIRDGEPCGEVPCPKLLVPPRPFKVERCESFKHQISDEVFKDFFGADDLILSITALDGQTPPNWIAVEGHSIVGIVSHHVIDGRSHTGKHNITLRATNKLDCYIETWVEMTIDGTVPQLYYRYNLDITENQQTVATSLSQDLSRQINVCNKVNDYFGYAIFDINSYTSTSNNEFTINWSVCNLPNKCTEDGLKIPEAQIFNSQDEVLDSFKNIFASEYTLKTITEDISDSCKVIDPPSPKENPLQIIINYCGGLVYTIPDDTFTDAQDGNTRNLKLYFEVTRGAPASNKYSWIDFNQETQTLHIMPTYDQARSFLLNFQIFLLTAEDSSGQTSTIQVMFTMNLPADPKYWYTFIMAEFDVNSINSRFLFMDKLASYRGDPDRKSIGLRTVSSNRIDYFNCSISLTPCDLYQFEQVKLSYSNENDLPKDELVTAMQPDFHVISVTSQYISPCGGPTPPKVNTTPAEVIINICGYTIYQIPQYTFYDCEEGPTQNLELSLTVKSGESFNMFNFVQFSSSSQSLTIIPRAEVLTTNGRNYEFTLTATDSSQLTISTSLNVQVNGAFELLRECQIQVTVKRSASTTVRTDIEAMTFIIQKLASYFDVTISEIGIVNFFSIDANTIFFAWSYCSAMYTQESHSVQTATVDYINFQQKILMKLFLYNRKTVNPNFYTAFDNEYTVTQVQTVFTKRCENQPPITLVDAITIHIGYGGYYVHTYQDNYFYDFEDGWAYSLMITLLDSMKTQVLIDHWVNVDTTTHNIIAVVIDYIRFHSSSSFTYYLQASDTIGQTTLLQVNIIKTTEVLTFAPFNITYLLEYTGGSSSLVYSTQSSTVINQITSFWSSVTTIGHVLVRWYYQASGYSQYRVITWSLHGHTCDSDVLAYIKNVHINNNGDINPDLLNSISSTGMFTLQRVYYHTTCESCNIDPPELPLPSVNVEYCSIYSYQLPATLFNSDCGGTYSMQLRLLYNGQSVSRSSWIQMNSATMEIYAVAIQSIMQTQTNNQYQIEATSSSGETTTSSFTAVIIDQPFTVDCKITMVFSYQLMTSTVVHLDIIRHFIEVISSYYKDSSVKIKILNFMEISENSFEIIWSNCSFTFASKQLALQGLTEDYRSQITQIFSQLVTSSGSVQEIFKQFMSSSSFQITTLTVNYDCIETPPTPTTKEIISFAKFCEQFNDNIPEDTFIDERDGNTMNLKLTLTFTNGETVPIDHWLQTNEMQNVYGVVTNQIKEAAGINGFKYLLVTTDSAGLTANISYTVKITSPIRDFDVYFRTGFTNRFDMLENTATIVYQFVEKTSKYLDENDDVGSIYVKEFTYPSIIEWVPCNLKPCIVSSLQNVINKLVSENGVIRPEFIQGLSPDIIPITTRLNVVNPGKCSSTNTTIIITNPPPDPEVPICGYWTYKIRSDQFRDVLSRETALFYLNFFYQNGGTIPTSSWIRFNSTEQYIYGISIASQITETSQYQLEAKHQSSGMTSSVTTTVTISDYSSYSRVSSNLCYIVFDVTVKYNEGYDDVTILKYFMETLASYLETPTSNIQIESYVRFTGYPYNFLITWTNCELTRTFIQSNYAPEYYTSFTEVINKLIQVDNTMITTINPEIQRFFTSSSLFVINSIKTTGNCSEPPNKPPIRNKGVRFPITCGVFAYKIPDDTFTDENGGVDQLSLTFKNYDGSPIAADTWIILNRTGYLIGMLKDNATYFSAINGEHKFKLEAKDSQGLTGETDVIVEMPSTPIPPTPYKLFVALVPNNQYPNDILLQYEIAERLNQEFLKLTLTNFNLFVETFSNGFLPGSYLIYLAPCSLCNAEISKSIEMSILFQDLIIANFKPEFEVSSVYGEYDDTVCSDVFQPMQIINETIPYCSYWIYDITKLEGEISGTYSIDFRTKDGQPLPKDSWITYEDYTIQAYPPESFWESPTRERYKFEYDLVRIEDGSIPGYTRNIDLVLDKDPDIPDETIIFTIRLSSTTPRDPTKTNNYYISLIMKALVQLLGSGNGIHFVSYNEITTNPFVFEVEWQNCTLPTDCKNTDINDVNNIILRKNSLGSYQITDYIPGDYIVEDVENKCSNKPPTTQTSLNLTVTVCGVFTYKLDENIVTNKDGQTLKDFTVTMLQENGNELSIDSWIRYDSSLKHIYALPNEAVSTVETPFVYKLKFTDSFDLSSEMPVYVSIVNNEDVFYGMSITFNSLMSINTPYLDLQLKMLELISTFIEGKVNVERYRTLVFQHTTSTQFYYRFGDCQVDKNICKTDNDKLEENEEKLFLANNKLTSNFQQFIQDYFNGIEMKEESGDIIVDTSPVTSGTDIVITVDQCQAICVDYMDNFYDTNQPQETLVYVLQTETGENVSKDYWTQLDGNQVCVYPWLNETTGTYKFNVKATDKCGNTVVEVITVIIRSVYKEDFGYKWKINSEMVRDMNLNDVTYLRLLREKMINFLKVKLGNRYSENQLQIIDYLFQNNLMEISFGDCSITYKPCNQSAVSLLATTIFTNNQPDPKLVEIFDDVINTESMQVEGKRQFPCGEEPEGPKCDESKLIFNASVCTPLAIKIPAICNDDQDGGIRNLQLKLYTKSYTDIPMSSWLQFNKTSQTIYGYPLYESAESKILREYRYILEISDKDGNQAVIDICVYLNGPLPTLDYQVTLEGQLRNVQPVPFVDQQICMLTQLKSYFNEGNLTNINYEIENNHVSTNTAVKYTFGFCEMRFEPCDCMMVKRTRLLYENFNQFQNSMSSCIDLTSVSYMLYGTCANSNPPTIENGIRQTVTINVGSYNEEILPVFKDLEDGGNENLTIVLLDSNNKEVSLETLEWMTLDETHVCGILSYYTFQRDGLTTEQTYTYYVTAIDSCGKEKKNKYNVKIVNNYPALMYRIQIWFTMPYTDLIGNCSKMDDLLQNIADYAEVPKENIIIDTLSASNETVNGTYFVWGVRKFSDRNCDDEEFEIFREKFIIDDKGNEKFITYMKENDFEIHDMTDWYDKECNDWEFPWWLIILILLLLLLLLFLWLLWICIPRCCIPFCTTCWGRCCGGCCGCCDPFCKACCTRNGKCASLRDKDIEEGSIIKEESGTNNKEGSDDEDGKPRPDSPVDSVDGGILPNVHPEKENIIPGATNTSEPSEDGSSPIPLPTPIPLPPTMDPYHTESWTDKRIPMVISTNTRHNHEYHDGRTNAYHGHDYHDGRKDVYRDTHLYRHYDNGDHTDSRHYSYEDSHGGQLIPYDHRHKEIRYVYEPYHHKRSKDRYIVYDDGYDASYYGNKDVYRYHSGHEDVYRNHSRHADGEAYYVQKSDANNVKVYDNSYDKHVHVKQPVAVRVRKSELEEYLRSEGRYNDGEVILKPKDLEKLMKGNAKFSFLNRQEHHHKKRHRRHKSRGRLADALVDRRIIYADAPRHHKRSYSTSSMNDFIAVDQDRRKVAIKPESIRFRMKGYDDVNYTTSSSSSGNRHIYVTKPSYKRQVVIEPRTSSSSSDERRVLIKQPSTVTRRRHFTDTSLTDSSQLSDIVVIPRRTKRQKIYEVTEHSNNDNDNNRHGSSSKGYEMKHSTYNKTFVNKGYNYDDSEC